MPQSHRMELPVTASSPIYVQLARAIRQQIMDGKIQSGEALPSERDLCTLLGASRVTIRKAIELLMDEGLLSRKQGSGTYVAPRIQAPASFLTSFSEDAIARGEISSTVWISKESGLATDEEADMLNLGIEAPVVRLVRVRMASGDALAIENAVIPAAMLPEIDQLEASLYDALSRLGNRPISGQQKVRAALANANEAALLGIDEGSEVLRIERLTRRADGSPVEFTKSTYRGDRYEFVSDLRGVFQVV